MNRLKFYHGKLDEGNRFVLHGVLPTDMHVSQSFLQSKTFPERLRFLLEILADATSSEFKDCRACDSMP